MTRIHCVNSVCSSPDKKFDWDESPHIEKGGEVLAARESGAKSVVAVCTYCGTQNKVWLKVIKKKDKLRRG